jgi:hypothetical protein
VPEEVIVVTKDGHDARAIEAISNKHPLHVVLLYQSGGFFTQALNVGKQEAKGDIWRISRKHRWDLKQGHIL